jgi:hypothetical protein
MCLSPSPSVRRRREAKLASLMAPGNIPMELPFGHSMPAETLPQYASQRVRVEPAVVECIKVRAIPIHVAQARGRAPYHTQSPPNLTTAGHPVCASDGNPSASDRHQPNQAPRRPERHTPGFRQLAVAVDFNIDPHTLPCNTSTYRHRHPQTSGADVRIRCEQAGSSRFVVCN